MPARAPRIVRKSFALLLAGGLALLAVVSGSLWLAGDARHNARQAEWSQETRSHAYQVQILVQDAETGQRGYLLTGDGEYLRPYQAAVRALPREMADLRRALAAEGRQGELDRGARLIRQKMDELAQNVELTRAGRTDEALALVQTDRGRVLMDGIRTETDKIIAASDARVEAASGGLLSSARLLATVSIAAGLLVVLFVLAAGWSLLRYTQELVRARTEVQALNQELEARVAARTLDLVRANEEIQRFAYIVSHDLRAPLVNIMGFTSELQAGLGMVAHYFERTPRERSGRAAEDAARAAREEMPEALDFIRSSTEKMDRLINAILKISREGGRVLAPEEVDLGPLIERQADVLRHQFEATGASFAVEGRPPTIISDRLALEQVFGNLIDNAVKYLDRKRSGRIAVNFRDIGSRVEITVEDNGRGISEQDFGRIFELFRRSGAQDRPGEGIGLPHVRAMVRRLGGEITVESELNKGSCFRVVLPKTLSVGAGEASHG